MRRVSSNGLSLLLSDEQAVVGQQLEELIPSHFDAVIFWWRLEYVIEFFGADPGETGPDLFYEF